MNVTPSSSEVIVEKDEEMQESEKQMRDSKDKEAKDEPNFFDFLPALLSPFADYFGLGCITPLLPFFVEAQGADTSAVGFILSAQYTGVILGSTIIGLISDRIGRRNTLIFALVGDVILFTATGFVTSIPAMVVVRFFAGFFTPLAACIAWVNDVSGNNLQARVKFNGNFALSSSIGFITGAAVGGFGGYNNFQYTMVLCGFLALAALVVTVRATEPTRPNAGAPPAGLTTIMSSKLFKSLTLSMFAIGLQFTGLTTLVSIVMLDRFGYSEAGISLILIGVVMLHLCIFLIMPAAIAKYGVVKLIVAGYSFTVLPHVAFMFPFVYDYPLVCVGLFIACSASLPLGMAGGNILAPIIADKYGNNARGATVGMLRTIFNVGQAIGPSYAVILYTLDDSSTNNLGISEGSWFFVIQGALLICASFGLISAWSLDGNNPGENEKKVKAMGGGEQEERGEMLRVESVENFAANPDI